MELKKQLIKMIRQIRRPDVIKYIYQIVADIMTEINPPTS